MVRSSTTYEECCGQHIISQGGYYQYDLGFQGAFRDPLQHVLPMIYADPWLAREVLALLGAAAAAATAARSPTAIGPLARAWTSAAPNDLDMWLLLTAAEYGSPPATSPSSTSRCRWPRAAATRRLWEHLKRARQPAGVTARARTAATSRRDRRLVGLLDAVRPDDRVELVTAQVAYVYPRMAELARAARRRRRSPSGCAPGPSDTSEPLAASGPDRGWYARGYRGVQKFGVGAIYGEPQPWAMLAGAPTTAQARTARRQRPPLPAGSAPRGGSTGRRDRRLAVPRRRRPRRERDSTPAHGRRQQPRRLRRRQLVRDQRLARLGARRARRRRPGARARTPSTSSSATRWPRTPTAYPDHWNGVLSVDDACRSWYSTTRALRRRAALAPTLRPARSPTSPPGCCSRRDQAGRRRADRAGY